MIPEHIDILAEHHALKAMDDVFEKNKPKDFALNQQLETAVLLSLQEFEKTFQIKKDEFHDKDASI